MVDIFISVALGIGDNGPLELAGNMCLSAARVHISTHMIGSCLWNSNMKLKRCTMEFSLIQNPFRSQHLYIISVLL